MRFPKKFSAKWWRLWFSGAFHLETIFRNVVADEIEKAGGTRSDYRENPDILRNGGRVPYSVPMTDLCARVYQDLRMRRWDVYDKMIDAVMDPKIIR